MPVKLEITKRVVVKDDDEFEIWSSAFEEIEDVDSFDTEYVKLIGRRRPRTEEDFLNLRSRL